MLTTTERGLYCEAGDFFVDPWRPVDRAIITHAHGDHARPGSRAYLCAADGVGVLRERLGASAHITGIPYGESVLHRGVRVSLHPAGHVLGSAQVRLEWKGDVWVVSGDYKTHPDPTCAAFEPVPCATFITESTFGLPIYQWQAPESVLDEIRSWWRANQERNRTSILFGYALGKSQRLLAGMDPAQGPILVHSGVARLLPAYAAAGVSLPAAGEATRDTLRETAGRALVIAPPAVADTDWLGGAGEISTAFASGWMRVRGTRRRLSADRGFALSDHADWPGLMEAIRATGAGRVLVTHGYVDPLVRWLAESGWEAQSLATHFETEVPS